MKWSDPPVKGRMDSRRYCNAEIRQGTGTSDKECSDSNNAVRGKHQLPRRSRACNPFSSKITTLLLSPSSTLNQVGFIPCFVTLYSSSTYAYFLDYRLSSQLVSSNWSWHLPPWFLRYLALILRLQSWPDTVTCRLEGEYGSSGTGWTMEFSVEIKP